MSGSLRKSIRGERDSGREGRREGLITHSDNASSTHGHIVTRATITIEMMAVYIPPTYTRMYLYLNRIIPHTPCQLTPIGKILA